MLRYSIAREDTVYKCFPDLARCGDGTLILVYRESLGHIGFPFSRIVIQRSFDEGCNWTRKAYVAGIRNAEEDGIWNNPRVVSIGGRKLILICDWLPPNAPEGSPKTEIHLWYSDDAGETWSDKHDTGIRGHICPCIAYLRNGTLIIAGIRTAIGRRTTKTGGTTPSCQIIAARLGKGRFWSVTIPACTSMKEPL